MELVYQKSTVNLGKLTKELSSIADLLYMTHYESALTVVYSRDLNESELTQINSIVSSHTAIDYNAIVYNSISNAMDFGRQIMIEFGTENVLLGATTEQIKNVVVKLTKIQTLLVGGALHTALEELDVVEPDVFLTQQRLDSFKNKIRAYLGMPLV